MKYPNEWEYIESLDISRLKVFGGWIVIDRHNSDEENAFEPMVFIPDIKHEWIIEEDKSFKYFELCEKAHPENKCE